MFALEERARVEVLIAQPLVELHSLVFDLFACRVVRADEQIPDDLVLHIAKGRHRDHGGKPAPVLANVRQLVNVFDPAGRLNTSASKGRDLRPELDTQRFGASDDFLRVGEVRRGDLVITSAAE